MPSPVSILDCTLRDGAHAIDDQFGADDTFVIARALERAGFDFIEVGHSLGLGAWRNPNMAASLSDEDVLRAAVAAARSAKVGMLFIPGIGRAEDLERAADLGLGFVRIGVNVNDVGLAAPFCSLAKQLGLLTSVNLMKAYAVTAGDFGDIAAAAEQFGADTVCVVDSAGGMLPEEVRAHVGAARARTASARIGFHGHNDLQLAIANTLAAVEAGATVIDSCLRGTGRTAANTQTEVLVAVLDRLGYRHGIDAAQIQDLGERVAHKVSRDQGVGPLSIISGSGSDGNDALDLATDHAADAPAGAEADGGRPAKERTLDDALTEVRQLSARAGKPSLFTLSRTRCLEWTAPRFHRVIETSGFVVGSVEYPDLEVAEDILLGLDGNVDHIGLDSSAGADELDHLLGYVERSAPIPYSNTDATIHAAAKLILELVEHRGAERIALVGLSPRWAGLVWSLAERDLDITVVEASARGLPAQERTADELENIDLLVGCSPGRPYVRAEMLQRVRGNGAIVDAGGETLSPESLDAARDLGLPVFRLDPRPGLAGELETSSGTRDRVNDIVGVGQVAPAPASRAHITGHPGSVVVDHVGSPICTIGVADGDGGLYADANEAIERIERALLARQFAGDLERESN